MAHVNVNQARQALAALTATQLKAKYQEVWGTPSRSGNKAFLVKKVLWGLQAKAEGGLSDRAKRRALELAREADLRVTALTEGDVTVPAPVGGPGGRLPPPGTVLTRTYKGRLVQVTVLKDGFEYDGAAYTSLSAIARHVTGTPWNGYTFFGLKGGKL